MIFGSLPSQPNYISNRLPLSTLKHILDFKAFLKSFLEFCQCGLSSKELSQKCPCYGVTNQPVDICKLKVCLFKEPNFATIGILQFT